MPKIQSPFFFFLYVLRNSRTNILEIQNNFRIFFPKCISFKSCFSIIAVIFFLLISPRKVLNFLKMILIYRTVVRIEYLQYTLSQNSSVFNICPKFALSQEIGRHRHRYFSPEKFQSRLQTSDYRLQTLIFSVTFLRMSILCNHNIVIKFRKFNI